MVALLQLQAKSRRAGLCRLLLLTLLLQTLLGLAAGCASPGSPVVADHSPVFGPHPASYQVIPGDTLYSIAWRYGLDVAALARLNRIGKPFTIYPNQKLRLRSAGSTRPSTSVGSNPSPPIAPSSSASQPVKSSSANWAWPVNKSPVLTFGEQGSGAISRGLYYELPHGTAIRAAAAGKVVYAGPGLGGYERLIILEHDHALLSAYGFHGQPKVKEKEMVKVATQLADTLGSGARFSRFHFEVRKHGRPIDPKRLISRTQ